MADIPFGLLTEFSTHPDALREIERLRAENTALRKAAGEEGRANRMTMLYESAQTEIAQLRAAGDALAQSYERALAALGIDWDGRQQSLRAWQEARRG